MRRKCIYIVCLLAGAAAWNGARACAQTDIAASIYGAFNASTTSGGVAQQASDSAGGLLEVRHIHNSLVGFEGAYSYHRANQTYSSTVLIPLPCPPGPAGCYAQMVPVAISANAQAITGDWVVSRRMRKLRPFALIGGGLLLVVPSGGQRYTLVSGIDLPIVPSGSQMSTNTATEFLFIFGAGLDWELASHFGLRLQDRENIYPAPRLTTFYPSTGALTYTQEPALGVYYRF